MRLVITWLAALGVVLSLACTAQAARVALVVGNGGYRQAPALPNALNDARDMAAALRGLGFRVVEGTDLTREALLGLVEDFARELEPQDLALFYMPGTASSWAPRTT